MTDESAVTVRVSRKDPHTGYDPKGPVASSRVVSVLAGLLGLEFVLLMIIGDAGNPGAFGPIGHGGAERMIVYPAMLWMLAFGGSLMAGISATGHGPFEA